MNIKQIPRGKILIRRDPDGHPVNPRGRILDTTDLQRSIAAARRQGKGIFGSGLLFPLIVSPSPNGSDKYHVNDGHRRMVALDALGYDSIPVMIAESAEESQAVAKLMMLAYNLQKPINPMDRAEALQSVQAEAVDSGWSFVDVLAVAGVDRAEYKLLCDLLEADEGVRQAVRDGRMSISAFKKIAKQRAERQAAILEEAAGAVRNVDGRVSVEAIRAAKVRVQQTGAVDAKSSPPGEDNPVIQMNRALAIVRTVLAQDLPAAERRRVTWIAEQIQLTIEEAHDAKS